MNIKSILLAGVMVLVGSFAAHAESSQEYFEKVNAADKQLILENYSDAENLYKRARSLARNANEKGYIHYKLGSLYLRLNDRLKAKKEWQNGLELFEPDKSTAGIGVHLKQALINSGL